MVVGNGGVMDDSRAMVEWLEGTINDAAGANKCSIELLEGTEGESLSVNWSRERVVVGPRSTTYMDGVDVDVGR